VYETSYPGANYTELSLGIDRKNFLMIRFLSSLGIDEAGGGAAVGVDHQPAVELGPAAILN
jgi:hypothetical protein